MLFRLKSITLSAQNSSCTIQRWRMRFRLFISPHFSGRQIEVYSVCLLVIWIYDPLAVVTLQNSTNWFTAPCKLCFPILLFGAKKSIVRFSPCLSILAFQLPTTLPSCRITGLKIPKLLCALAVCFFSRATQLICSSPLHFTRTKVQIYWLIICTVPTFLAR